MQLVQNQCSRNCNHTYFWTQ